MRNIHTTLTTLFSAILAVFILPRLVSSSNIPSPVQCNSTGCTVTFYQGIWLDRRACYAAAVVYPTHEQEIINAVAHANKARKKVKVISKGSHSYPKLVCPGGDDGLVISTRDYNSQILIDAAEMTVTADAGVELRTLVDRIAEAGLTLTHAPLWEGVSVAGLISTGAHGSGLWGKGSAPHDYVVGIRLIATATEEEGYAKVVSLTIDDEDLDAARLSLGVLGVISKVTFLLEPMFKRSVKLELREDVRLEDEIVEFARKHEFGLLNWYPVSKKVLFRLEDRVSVATEGDGANNLPAVAPMDLSTIELLSSAAIEADRKRNAQELCTQYEMLISDREKLGDGLVNQGTSFTHYPVVGYNHRLQTAGGCQNIDTPIKLQRRPSITPTNVEFHSSCEEDPNLIIQEAATTEASSPNVSTCYWNPLLEQLAFSFFDTSISVPMTLLQDAILDIKKLRDQYPHAMCSLVLYGGIWIRFLKASKAYLGEKVDSAVIEIFYYRSKEPNQPTFNEDVYEEIEQMLLKKYGGKPHWGKNRNLAFEDMKGRTTNMEKFIDTQRRFDPSGLFSSEWSDAILGISTHANPSHSVQILQDYCALEGLCVCSEDSHCHPSKGYYCRGGRLFKEARVCRYEDLS